MLSHYFELRIITDYANYGNVMYAESELRPEIKTTTAPSSSLHIYEGGKRVESGNK